ncbi:MAG TPA: SPOR domain-containing protein [Candidatus Tectomicrobia bacterium]
MEHTITANGIRHGHTGGLVLSQLHIGLAVGFAIVACLTAFGGGMIVGMWYKASEQGNPLSAAGPSTPEAPAPSQESVSQPPEPPAPVTFYNTLTNSSMAYAPLTPLAPGGPTGHAKGAVAPAPAPGPTSEAKAVPAGPASAREATPSAAVDSAKTVTVSKTTPSVGGTTRTAAVREAQKPTKATPAPKAAPSETESSAAGTPTAAQKPAGKGTESRRPAAAPAAAPAKAPAAEDFSVQVGSFGSSEQAERLRTNLTQKGYPARVQLSSVPGKGLRYRVRVGSYSERAAADQTAHHLTAQEQVPAIVAGKD